MASKQGTAGTEPGLAGAQTSRAVMELRNLIASGAIQPDERLTEVMLATRLGMSRTPIRAAVQHLREEGLLEAQPGGGFSTRAFGQREIGEAIELRGMIEGLVARQLAERGVEEPALARLAEPVERIEAVVGAADFGPGQILAYLRLNAEFHDLLAETTGAHLKVCTLNRVNLDGS